MSSRVHTPPNLLSFLLPIAAVVFTCQPAISQVKCDTTCTPNPGSNGYGSTIAAMSMPSNLRGGGSVYDAVATGSEMTAAGRKTKTQPGSESYTYAIPIVSLPGRAGLDLNLTLHYNSRIWNVNGSNITFNPDRDFPSYGFRLDYGFIEFDSMHSQYLLMEQDGTKRTLSASGAIYVSTDSSFIQYTPASSTLYYKNGTRVFYQVYPAYPTLLRPIKIEDTNGNFISISYRSDTWAVGSEIDTITDTLGRTITFAYDPTSHLLLSVAQGAITYVQLAWNTAYTLKYSFTQTTTNSPANNAILSVVDHCTVTNGTGYYFIYGDWGVIKEIDFKSSSGALRSSISYNYPLATTTLSNPPTYATQAVFDGVNTAVWQYATNKTGQTVNSMSVTDPYGTLTKTTLSGGLASTVTVTPSGGTVLRTSATTWSSGSNPTVSNVVTTLNDSGEQSKTAYLYDTYANITEVQEYDYGLAYRRRIVTAYKTDLNYVNLHIYSLPAQVNLYDETGGTEVLKARTDFSYDGSTPQSYMPAPAQLDSTITSFRGNLTTKTRYEDPANLSTAIARSYSYDVAGNLVTANLDCCNTRVWVYDSTTQYSYPSSVTSGPVGTQLTDGATYYPDNGQIRVATDANGQQTTYTYDSSYRLTDVFRPDGIHYGTDYDDAAASPSITETSPTDSTKTTITVTTTDGAHRPTQQTMKTGTGTVISVVDMVYDSLGRQTQMSLPHASGGTPTYTTTVYDGINRVSQLIPADGSVSSNNTGYSYYGSSMTVTDATGKQRKTYNDAFGRVRRVDEPGGSPASATLHIAGNEQVCNSGCGNGGPLYDEGTATLTMNGVAKTAAYAQGSTNSSVASDLRNAFNSDLSAGVIISGGGNTLIVTSTESGTETNYTFSVTSHTNLSRFFTAPSFSGSPVSGALSGGSDTSASASLLYPFATYYSYDAMDHLTLVKQGPRQVRNYAYNGVGRLVSEQTPEAGPVTFSYTTTGAACSTEMTNVCSRTDARGVVTAYTYDGLSRLKKVTYPAGTPTVTLNYDTGGAAAFALGRLTSMVDGVGSETYTYDKLGRATNIAKVISSTSYNVSYAYNYVGETKSLTYPSGRVVTQQFDDVGRLNQIGSGGTSYLAVPANGLTPAGLPTTVNYGNGVVATLGYNARLQLTTLDYAKGSTDLLNLTYAYNQTANSQSVNNGQIQGITDTRGDAFSTNYSYDTLGRLAQAQTLSLTATNTWKLQWTYDRYGNRLTQNLTGGTIGVTQPQLIIDPTTNRISTAGYLYDAAGNLTNDSLHAYTFDAEKRMITVDAGQTNNTAYSYNGTGMRVKKVVTAGSSSTTTIYIYSGSKVLAEYSGGTLTAEYVYAGNQLLVTIAGGAVKYRHSDHLSSRLETDANGVATRTFGQLPFGETWYETGTTSKWKFNSYERDSESGLDYAIFRYDTSRLGRFMTPDHLGGALRDPQSLNRYSYVKGDPLNLIDPVGLSSKFYLVQKIEVHATVEDIDLIRAGDIGGVILDGVPVETSSGGGVVGSTSGAGGSGADGGKNAAIRKLLSVPDCFAFVLKTLRAGFDLRNRNAYLNMTSLSAKTAREQNAGVDIGLFSNTLFAATFSQAANPNPNYGATAGLFSIEIHPGFASLGPAITWIHETFHLAPYGFTDTGIADALGLSYKIGKTAQETTDNASAAWTKELEKPCGDH